MYLDLFVLAIFGLNIYIGHRRGLVDMVLSIAIFIVALFLARTLYTAFAAFFMTTPLYHSIVQWVVDYISLGATLGEITGDIQADLLGRLPLPAFIVEALNLQQAIEINNILDISSLEILIAEMVAGLIINIISALALFLFFIFGLRLISKSINLLTRLPFIRGVNKGLGAVAGGLRAFIIVWVFLLIYNLILARPDNFFMDQLLTSTLALWLHERNLFLSVILGILG